MRKKILVVGPCLTQSGYGYQTRFALKALRSREDLFEVFIEPINWGKTGWIWEDTEFRQWMDERIAKTQMLQQEKHTQLDMTLQVTIPNEWKKVAPVNIGYTAGIETTKVSPQWLPKGNEMDKIIVVSNHAKSTYENTIAMATNKDTNEQFPYRLQTPIAAVNYSIEEYESAPINNLNLEYGFNFLAVCQNSPRKNMTNTVQWWVEEFIDQEVGLVVKTNIANNCLMDRKHTENLLRGMLNKYTDRKCKVYLLHGDLTNAQMHGLYQNPKIKSFINLAHGEGFGLPIFEAALHGVPIVTIPWSGQMDFLHHNNKNFFQVVEYTLQPIQQNVVWPGVIEADSMWAYADQGSYKMALRKVFKHWNKAKTRADELKEIIKNKFNEKDIYKQFCDEVYGDVLIQDDEIESLFLSLSEE